MFSLLLGLLLRAARLLLGLLLPCCSPPAADATEAFVSKRKISEDWRFSGEKPCFSV
jgi:hypothetical protein